MFGAGSVTLVLLSPALGDEQEYQMRKLNKYEIGIQSHYDFSDC